MTSLMAGISLEVRVLDMIRAHPSFREFVFWYYAVAFNVIEYFEFVWNAIEAGCFFIWQVQYCAGLDSVVVGPLQYLLRVPCKFCHF